MTKSSKKSTTTGSKPAKSTSSVKADPAGTPPPSPKAAPKKPAAVRAAPAAKAGAKKPAAKRPAAGTTPKAKGAPTTTISVEADVGFGNQLFIRGSGPGLHWNQGVPMTCKDSSHWEWSGQGVTEPVEFKVLINDQLWSQGENEQAQPGEQKVVHPSF